VDKEYLTWRWPSLLHPVWFDRAWFYLTSFPFSYRMFINSQCLTSDDY
jgi:hypothetical protein